MKLNLIRIDGGTQSRTSINEAVVAAYAEELIEGAKFPPVVVFFDGTHYWLADGFHRFLAHQRAGLIEIDTQIKTGTQRDAQLFSVGVNADHGLPRTADDKRKAVLTLLNDAEWGKWGDREIARRCRVSHSTVGALRSSLDDRPVTESAERTYVTKHGTTATMDTSKIGKAKGKPVEQEQEKPPAPPAAQAPAAAPAPAAEAPAAQAEKPAEAPPADDGPSEEELAAAEREQQAEYAALQTLIGTDDKLGAAYAEIKRLTALVLVLEERLRGLQNSNNEHIRLVKSWKGKYEKLAKQVNA